MFLDVEVDREAGLLWIMQELGLRWLKLSGEEKRRSVLIIPLGASTKIGITSFNSSDLALPHRKFSNQLLSHNDQNLSN